MHWPISALAHADGFGASISQGFRLRAAVSRRIPVPTLEICGKCIGGAVSRWSSAAAPDFGQRNKLEPACSKGGRLRAVPQIRNRDEGWRLMRSRQIRRIFFIELFRLTRVVWPILSGVLFEREHRTGERVPNRALRRPDAGAPQLRYWPRADGPAILARRGGHGARFDDDSIPGYQQRALGLVCRGACIDGVSDFCHDALLVAAPNSVKVR
jgi:hypothetical protein